MREKVFVFKSREMLLGGSALFLLFSFLPVLSEYKDFFLFIGISSLIGGVFPFLFHPKLVYRDKQELLEKNVAEDYVFMQNNLLKNPFSIKQSHVTTILFIIVIGGFLINQILLMKYNAAQSSDKNQLPSVNTVNTASLTAIDQSLKAELQQQGKEIPVLGTAHDHADLNVYVNGERLIVGTPTNYMKSSFMHLDNSQNQSDANSVLHMHAKKVPLWMFFRSLGMNLTKDSLTLADGRVLKNENGKTLKFYLDGKKVDELGDYSFQPLDKLLISFGPENDPNLSQQIKAMTNFAKDHQK